MADKEEELSPFDRWEAESREIKEEVEQQQSLQETEQQLLEDPTNVPDYNEQATDIGQDLQSQDVEHHEMSTTEQAELQTATLETPDPVKDNQPTQDMSEILAQSGQSLNQAGVETQEQTSFDKWEAQKPETPEPTQLEPQQEQNQEPER